MIEKKMIDEIKSRDFFQIVNHYHDYDNIETELKFGSWGEKEVFLSIIIPVYDHPIDFIIRAIESAKNQNISLDYKILIIDDYAFEGKNNGVEDYVLNHPDDKIIYYKNKKNMGVFANWNRGIMLSKAKWITILHSDDFFKPNYLKTMVSIINAKPEIDQIACPYEMIDYTNGDVDEEKYRKPYVGKAILRKVDYREYMYGMFTSVKGSMYTKKSLIEIGGFMNQGDGLGLDDYPLMMRYAYYYNTYYLDKVLYVDSWGFNDSLNLKHWYPELIANFFMWKCMERKRKGIIKWAYSIKDKYNLVTRAHSFEDGTSWVKKKIDIDYEELYRVCNISSEHIPFFTCYASKGLVKMDQKVIKFKQKKEVFYVEP